MTLVTARCGSVNRRRLHAPVHGAGGVHRSTVWVLQIRGRTPERAAGFQPQSNRLVKKSYLL